MPEYTQNTFLIAHNARSFTPAGYLSEQGDELGLSQAVVIPDGASLVVTSGQRGFTSDGVLSTDLEEQVSQTFANADATLKEAGVEDGWKSVYQMVTYTPAMTEEWLAAVQKNKDRYLGSNRPAWTGITVPALFGGAVIEITLSAFKTPKPGLWEPRRR